MIDPAIESPQLNIMQVCFQHVLQGYLELCIITKCSSSIEALQFWCYFTKTLWKWLAFSVLGFRETFQARNSHPSITNWKLIKHSKSQFLIITVKVHIVKAKIADGFIHVGLNMFVYLQKHVRQHLQKYLNNLCIIVKRQKHSDATNDFLPLHYMVKPS